MGRGKCYYFFACPEQLLSSENVYTRILHFQAIFGQVNYIVNASALDFNKNKDLRVNKI